MAGDKKMEDYEQEVPSNLSTRHGVPFIDSNATHVLQGQAGQFGEIQIFFYAPHKTTTW